MIDFDELFKTVNPVALREVGEAMLNGADAKTVQAMFAKEGVELSEEDIAKVSGGIVAKLAAMPELPEVKQNLSKDELDQVAGGGCGGGGGGCEE